MAERAGVFEAACHVHPAGAAGLGVIDTKLSLATVDEQMAQHQANLGIS